jgi:PEP-CTERM motif
MTLKTSIVATAAGLLLAATQASAVTITFEELADGATLSNQYAALGVLFSPNAFSGANTNSTAQSWATNTGMTVTDTDLGLAGAPLLASGKMLHSYGNFFAEDGDPSMLATFSRPVKSFSADFAGIDSSGDVTLTVYSGSAVIATVVATACIVPCQQTLSFSAPLITRVALAPGSVADWVGVDNITFTAAAPVPEASTVTMLALGMGLLALRRRRR